MVCRHEGIAAGIFFQRRNKIYKTKDDAEAQVETETRVGGASPEKTPGMRVSVNSSIQTITLEQFNRF